MTDGYAANGSRLMIDGVDDPKSSNSIFPEPFRFAAEWLAAGGIGCDRGDGSFDELFEGWMIRANDLRHRRLSGGEGAVRRQVYVCSSRLVSLSRTTFLF